MTNDVPAPISPPSARDLSQRSNSELVNEARDLSWKIREHEAALLVEAYETGPEWQTALAHRQRHLEQAFDEAGLDHSKIPKRVGPGGMEAKRREYIGRYQWRLEEIAMELERRGVMRE